jgi:hypothetical protein
MEMLLNTYCSTQAIYHWAYGCHKEEDSRYFHTLETTPAASPVSLLVPSAIIYCVALSFRVTSHKTPVFCYSCQKYYGNVWRHILKVPCSNLSHDTSILIRVRQEMYYFVLSLMASFQIPSISLYITLLLRVAQLSC